MVASGEGGVVGRAAGSDADQRFGTDAARCSCFLVVLTFPSLQLTSAVKLSCFLHQGETSRPPGPNMLTQPHGEHAEKNPWPQPTSCMRSVQDEQEVWIMTVLNMADEPTRPCSDHVGERLLASWLTAAMVFLSNVVCHESWWARESCSGDTVCGEAWHLPPLLSHSHVMLPHSR